MCFIFFAVVPWLCNTIESSEDNVSVNITLTNEVCAHLRVHHISTIPHREIKEWYKLTFIFHLDLFWYRHSNQKIPCTYLQKKEFF